MNMENDLQKHYSRIRQILVIVLLLNWAVAFAKIIFGILSRCSSMTADGFHSLSDGTSNIIGLIGIRLCSQPVDSDHPYGHKKYETLFSLSIAALLFVVAFNLAKQGVRRFYQPVEPVIDFRNFAVMIITLAINIWVMRYEYKKGKLLQSDILVSDSLHTKADIFTSISVIITLVAIKLGFPVFDPIATVIISLFIAYAGFEIVKQGSGILCDAIVIGDIKKIEDVVLSVKGVKSCHKIRTRGRPDDIYVDLHVQLNPDIHLDKAHRISYIIEEAIKKSIPEVTEVLVHLEPLMSRDNE